MTPHVLGVAMIRTVALADIGHALVLGALFLLVTVLLTAAAGKSLEFPAFRAQLRTYGLPSEQLAALGAAAIIGSEAICAVLIVFAPNTVITQGLTTALLASFFLLSIVDSRRGGTESCQCFGDLLPQMRRGTATLIRNSVLLATWLVVLISSSHRPLIGIWGLAGAAACVAVLIYLRTTRASSGMSDLPNIVPMPVGSALPSALRSLIQPALNNGNNENAARHPLSAPLDLSSPRILLFSRSDCGLCETLGEDIGAIDSASSLMPRTLVVTDQTTKWTGWNLVKVDNAIVTQLARSVGCGGVPCALMIDKSYAITEPAALGKERVLALADRESTVKV